MAEKLVKTANGRIILHLLVALKTGHLIFLLSAISRYIHGKG